jgi:MoaA/NifB/PqqE/SkfB family radical SAM enzyme
MVSEETLYKCYKALEDCRKDPRLKGLHALVFLAFKDTSGTSKYHPLTVAHWKQLMDIAMVYQAVYGIHIGFDTCSAPMFVKTIEKHPKFEGIMESVEGCESYRFSIYINVRGLAYPCSFLENYYDGENVLKTKFSKIWDGIDARSHRAGLNATNMYYGIKRCPVHKMWRKENEDKKRVREQ